MNFGLTCKSLRSSSVSTSCRKSHQKSQHKLYTVRSLWAIMYQNKCTAFSSASAAIRPSIQWFFRDRVPNTSGVRKLVKQEFPDFHYVALFQSKVSETHSEGIHVLLRTSSYLFKTHAQRHTHTHERRVYHWLANRTSRFLRGQPGCWDRVHGS